MVDRIMYLMTTRRGAGGQATGSTPQANGAMESLPVDLPGRVVICYATVPIRKAESVGLEQSLGEVDLGVAGSTGIMHVALAHNGSEVYFYKIKEGEPGHIPDGPILVLEMHDLMRQIAYMAGQGAFTWAR